MAYTKLPDRFAPAEADSFCHVCDKVRKLCVQCDCCREHCECPDTCELCGGYVHSQSLPIERWGEPCACLECVICGRKVDRDHADYGYGLTEEQAQENYGTAATAVCEDCVEAKRTPPPASERGFHE